MTKTTVLNILIYIFISPKFMEPIWIHTLYAKKCQKEKKTREQKEPKTFFQKIAFILLDNERKTEVAWEIIEDSNFNKLYRVQLILSGIICSLWLLINSVPVIIGAMLIAPILQPIKIIAFATSTGNGKLYRKWLRISWITILLIITIAWTITKITPVATLTPEIFARISPTTIDLFIALAWGIIAFLSLWFKKLWEGVAGVAMATALIPPLCVTGIGISFLHIEIAKGSFLLFLTNFVTIVFVWIIIFYAFGFCATNKRGKKHSIEGILLTIVTIVLIMIPLTQSMKNIADDMKTTQIIEKTSNDFLRNINKKIEIKKTSYQIQDNDTLRISTTIDVPNTTPITEKHKNELSQILALATQKSVNLDINIVNISSVLIEKKEEITKDQQFQKEIADYAKINTKIIIIESKIAYNPTPLVYLNLFWEGKINKEAIEIDIETISKKILWNETNVLILWHEKNGKKEQEERITNHQEIEKYIRENINKDIYINSLHVEEEIISEEEVFTITIELKSALSIKEIQGNIQNNKEQLQEMYQRKVIFKISTIVLSEMIVE